MQEEFIEIKLKKPARKQNFFWDGSKLGIGNTIPAYTTNTWQSNTVPMIIRGTPSQSADLTQWQSNSGTVLAYITSEGVFKLNEKALDVLAEEVSKRITKKEQG